MSAIFVLTLVVLLPADQPDGTETPRKPSPFAPSLPQLTDEEEQKLDDIIDRFIQFDTGKLRGEEGKKALAEFERLGPEATFALIRGVNRAANIDASCPAANIGKKLGRILEASVDLELLEFARENIGVGVTKTRHMRVIKDLRVACLVRKGVVSKKLAALRSQPEAKGLVSLSLPDLVKAAGSERGPGLRQVLVELEKRNGDQVIAALGTVAASYDRDTQKLARDLLIRHLSRKSAAVLKEKLKDENAEIRAAAAQVIGSKRLGLGRELINLLDDDELAVREAAHQALVRLSRGKDFGPGGDAKPAERQEAMKKWRDWWGTQDRQ